MGTSDLQSIQFPSWINTPFLRWKICLLCLIKEILSQNQAYQQLTLDRESRKYIVISTHEGLFRATRLPYGVSSVPGIFQRAIEMLLQGIPGVAVYIDDILITGQNNEVHLKSLQEVSHLERARLRAKRQKCIFTAPSVLFWGMLLVPKVYTPSLIKFK